MFKRILCIIFIFLFCSQGFADEPGLPLNLIIETDKESYVVGEEITVHGKIVNISDKEVVFYKNGELNDMSVYIKPSEVGTRPPTAGGFQTAEYYAPRPITLASSESLELSTALKLTSELKRFNYQCVEEKELDRSVVSKDSTCAKETFEEGERFVVRSVKAQPRDEDRILALNDGKYQVQAVYEIDSSDKNFWRMPEEEEDKETPQNLTYARTLQSNTVEITLSK